MWLSVGDLGTGVSIGSPSISLNTSGSPSTQTGTSGGFDWKTVYKSPFFWAAIIVVLFIIKQRRK